MNRCKCIILLYKCIENLSTFRRSLPCILLTAEFLVTLAVDAEVVGFRGRPLAATADEAHRHGVVLLVLQVVELCGKHIEQGGLLQ